VNNKVIFLIFSLLMLSISSQVSAVTLSDLVKNKSAKDRGAGQSLGAKKDVAIPDSASTATVEQKKLSDLNTVKPPKTKSFYKNTNDDNAKLEAILDQQIQELFKLTKKFETSSQRGEMWLRLAELYVEKAGMIDFRKQDEHDRKLQDYQSGKTKVRPVLDLKEAKEYNKKAIRLYEWFARDFPKDPKMDQALFFLGYNSFEINENQKGAEYYSELTKRFPKSSFIAESHFALGEFYFENEKWDLARENYNKVLKFRRHRLFYFALYKFAWTEYRRGQSDKALRTMEILLKYSRTTQDQNAEGISRKTINKSRLEGEALRDMVLFYAESGSAEKAPEYFQQWAGKESANYLDKLAYYYADKGNIYGARHVFHYLIKLNPILPKSFDYKYQVVKLFSTAKKSREFREEMFSWIKDFGPSSPWYATNKSNKSLIESSDKLRENTLRTYVLQNHQTAQNSRAPFSQALAQEGYRLYLAEFKDSSVYLDMHFFHAELLYDMGKYEEAVQQYRVVVEKGVGTKYYEKSAENIVYSLEKNIPQDEELAKSLAGQTEPIELASNIKKFTEMSQWYVQKFPNSDKVVDLKFKAGRIYYLHNQFDKAIPIFKEIVTKYPNSKYAEYSANLLLDAYNIKKDYVGLAQVGKELLTVPAIRNSKAGSEILGVIEKSSFKGAQDLEEQKNYLAAAQGFESFATQNPTSSLHVSALFNAAVNYERVGRMDKAAHLYEKVIVSGADSNTQLKSKRLLAKLYQDSGQFEEAAKMFQSVSRQDEKDPLSANMAFNAAVQFEAVGFNGEAIQNYRYYISKSPDKLEATWAIAQIYKKTGQDAKCIDELLIYIGLPKVSKEKVALAYIDIYELNKKLNKHSEAELYKNRILVMHRQNSGVVRETLSSTVAKVKLDEAKLLLRDLISYRIPENPSKQKEVIDKKISLVTKINAQLTEVVKIDSSEEIVSALKLNGDANQHMAESILQAPLPKGLNESETQQYKAGIKGIANPFTEKAIAAYESAYTKGQELDVFSSDYFAAMKSLQRLDFKKVKDHQEFVFQVNKLNSIEDIK